MPEKLVIIVPLFIPTTFATFIMFYKLYNALEWPSCCNIDTTIVHISHLVVFHTVTFGLVIVMNGQHITA